MKSAGGIGGMAPTILYFVAGVFWVAVLLAGGGVLLFWGALTCFLSGVLLYAWASSWVTRPLIYATALFGLVLTSYQLFVALSLIGTGLDPIAGITGAIFGVLTVIYLYLLLFGNRKTRAA
jgi:hypothetical protein